MTTDDEAKPLPKSWGHPSFADEYPNHPELDELVQAFADGDYARVREAAPKLIEKADTDEAVKKAASQLLDRTKPDPTSRLLFVIAAALIVFVTGWWIAHKEPHEKTQSPKRAKPTAPAASKP